MPKGIPRDWPSDDEIKKLLDECGSVNAAAGRLNVAETVLSRHIKRRGIAFTLTRTPTRAKAKTPAPGSAVSREETLEQQLAEARRALASDRKDEVREQRVIDSIERNLKILTPRYTPASKDVRRHGAEHEFVLLWSDAHAGEVVSAEETNQMGAYNWEIMLERHRQIVRKVLSYKEHRNYPVGKLHILGLGDGLSGNIHEELRETNEMPLEDAVVQYGEDMAHWIEEFVPEFPEIHVAGVCGNHPRTTKKPAAKRKYNNSDWTAYNIMRIGLRQYNSVQFEIPKAQTHPVLVYGRRILMFHGDTVQASSMVGVPTGGIVRHVAKLARQWALMGKPIDHTVCGHFHEVNVYGGKMSFINGSIKGPDEYGLDRFGLAQPPMQILLTFNQKHGLCDVSYLDLDAGIPALAA